MAETIVTLFVEGDTEVDFYKKLGYALVNEEVVRSGSFDCIRMNKYL